MSEAQPNSRPVVHQLGYKELDILHSLRGFCAFYVVIGHAKYILWSGGSQYLQTHPIKTWNPLDFLAFALDIFSSAGYEMVIFFFVLSGFFIHYAQDRKRRGVWDFYLNRIVRIYPPYLFSLLLAAGCLYAVAVGFPHVLRPDLGRELNVSLTGAWAELRNLSFRQAIGTLFFLPPGKFFLGYNSVYWSLLPEAIFYLLVPFVLRIPRWYYVLSIVGYVAGSVMQLHGHPNLPGQLLQYNLFFAVGSALYEVVVYTNWLQRWRQVSPWLVWIGLAALLVALIGVALTEYRQVSNMIATVLAFLSVSALLAGFVSRENPVVKALHWLGVCSFSLYLYHFPLLLVCYALLTQFTGELFVYARYYWLILPVVTALCYALYSITEKPSVKFFRKV